MKNAIGHTVKLIEPEIAALKLALGESVSRSFGGRLSNMQVMTLSNNIADFEAHTKFNEFSWICGKELLLKRRMERLNES